MDTNLSVRQVHTTFLVFIEIQIWLVCIRIMETTEQINTPWSSSLLASLQGTCRYQQELQNKGGKTKSGGLASQTLRKWFKQIFTMTDYLTRMMIVFYFLSILIYLYIPEIMKCLLLE